MSPKRQRQPPRKQPVPIVRLCDIPLYLVYQDSDTLPLSGVIMKAYRDGGPRSLLWCNRGLWGLIPKGTVENVMETFRDHNKLRGVFQDRPPKLTFGWGETVPVSARVAKLLEELQGGQELCQTVARPGRKADQQPP